MKKKIVELSSVATSTPKNAIKKKHNPDHDLEYMEDHMRTILLNLQNEKVQQVPSKREFRTSSLPFCPILDFLADPKFEDYSKSHYTSTGTAIHETLQSWMSMSKNSRDIMFGSWKCTGCGAVKLNQFRPKKLCDCSHNVSTTGFHRKWPKHWTYHEIEYDYHGLTGHIDMVMAPKPDFYYIPDIKTTEISKKRSKWNWKDDKVSSPTYIAQTRTYATILDLEFGLPIRGIMLINTERGAPIKTAADFHIQMANWSRKHSLRWQKHLDASVANNRILTKIEGAVREGDKDTAKAQIKRMVTNRPCHDAQDYKAYMSYKFYGATECPHKGTCCSGSNSAVLKMIMQELAKKD